MPVNGVPRLACRVYPADGDTVTLPESADGAILTRTLPPPACQPGRTGCAAAVDLGTTTVVARLYDLASGAELATESGWSAQAPYGADVISRIQYTLEQPDGLQELSQRSREQVWSLIERALVRCGRDADTLREITLVGNTVMQHLFAGYSVRGIAAAPFQPETLFDASETVPLHGVPVRAMSAGISRPACWPQALRSCRANICFSISAQTARWRSAGAAASPAAPWHPALHLRARASRAECPAWTARSAAYSMTTALYTT